MKDCQLPTAVVGNVKKSLVHQYIGGFFYALVYFLQQIPVHVQDQYPVILKICDEDLLR